MTWTILWKMAFSNINWPSFKPYMLTWVLM
uniref:Uncharacterized protein n=1 Tax=Anguilla anguilla TaxID=7936 RepID=A0A0E9P8M3_ANGAN